MKAQSYEPGYPCNHRSTPLYLEDPSVTLSSLHKNYKIECEEKKVRVLAFETFRRVLKFFVPTLHLGKTKTDVCNSCFSLDLQIKDPQTSPGLRAELIAAKSVHLMDAINMRKEIKMIYTSVRERVAPDDPPLAEEPVEVPPCFSDPFNRLNRTLVEDYQEGVIGIEEDVRDLADINDDSEVQLNEVREVDLNDNSQDPPPTQRKLRVTVQDFGAGIPLPKYGASQPNHDYYASNLTVHNMNFVNCATGLCDIAYYDERVAGKDGDAVCSLRWNNLKNYIIENKDNLPGAECKILDNCVGQNKSNTTHKFTMLESLLLFKDGVTDIYFKVGHSHNASDLKTAHANKATAKKNIFTPAMIASEVNKLKGLRSQIIEEKDGIFKDWKVFLDKHFPNMDPGFTSFQMYEFKNGVVDYKCLNPDGVVITVKSRTFCANPEATRKIILRELLNLSQTSTPVEIVKANLRLPPLPGKRVSKKKIDNMKVIYPQIPACHRWYYPEGLTVGDDPHTDLRRRAVMLLQQRAAQEALESQRAAQAAVDSSNAVQDPVFEYPEVSQDSSDLPYTVSGQVEVPAVHQLRVVADQTGSVHEGIGEGARGGPQRIALGGLQVGAVGGQVVGPSGGRGVGSNHGLRVGSHGGIGRSADACLGGSSAGTVSGGSIDTPSQKRRPGRPPTIVNLANQPAIHRYLQPRSSTESLSAPPVLSSFGDEL